MNIDKFLFWKQETSRKIKKVKALRGGEHRYVARATPRIDAEIAEKSRFPAETNLNRHQ